MNKIASLAALRRRRPGWPSTVSGASARPRRRQTAGRTRLARHPSAHRRLRAPPRQLHEQRQRLRRSVHAGRNLRRLVQEWGTANIWFRGREQLRRAGGGTDTVCRPRESQGYAYHLTINPVITPTATGARAISTLLTITNDTERSRRHRALGRRLRGHVREDAERLEVQIARARLARGGVDRPRRRHAAATARGRVSGRLVAAASGRACGELDDGPGQSVGGAIANVGRSARACRHPEPASTSMAG